jgi:membrane protein YfhO
VPAPPPADRAPRRQRWPGQSTRLHPRLIVIGVLVLVALALFPHALLGGRVFYYRDVHLQWVGQMEVLVRTVAAGCWPVWNPYASFGQPLLANPNYEVYYPPTLLNLVMAPWTYYRLFVFLHLLLAAVGTYALGRRLGLSPLAAGLGGVAWMASGPLVSLVSLWNHLAGAAWIPWSAWAGHRAVARPTFGACASWGAILAAPVLAGSPEMALFAGVFGVVFAVGAARGPDSPRRVPRALAVAGVVALGLSAAQWVPSLELARRSTRAALPAQQREFWSVPAVALLQCVFPALLDELPLQPPVRAALYESREPFLRSLYVGLSAAALVAVACASRRRAALVLAGLAVALAGFALGRHAPVAGLLEAIVPPLRVLRFPAKAMVPASLAWALLVGLGLQAWLSAESRRRVDRVARIASTVAAVLGLAAAWLVLVHAREVGEALLAAEFTHRTLAEEIAPVGARLLAAGAFALAIAGLAWRRPRAAALAGTLAAAVVAGDLLSANARLIPVADPELFTFRPPALRHLGTAPDTRVYSFDYFEPLQAERYLGHPGYLLKVPRQQWPVPWADAAALRAGLYPSLLAYWRVQDGFRIDPVGLYPPHMTALVAALRRAALTPAFHRLLQIGAVTHVVALHREGLEDLVPVGTEPSLFLEDVHVFQVPDALPRAYVVDGAHVAADADAARLLLDASFDLRREIVLAAGSPVERQPTFAGEARIVEWLPDRVVVEARLSGPGYVVLVEAHDPSWRATVDGQRTEVLRANVGFRAVAAPAGNHRIVFAYRPRAALIGLAVSMATLALCAVVLARSRRAARAPAALPA